MSKHAPEFSITPERAFVDRTETTQFRGCYLTFSGLVQLIDCPKKNPKLGEFVPSVIYSVLLVLVGLQPFSVAAVSFINQSFPDLPFASAVTVGTHFTPKEARLLVLFCSCPKMSW